MWKSPQCHHFRLSRSWLSSLKLVRRLKNLDERSEEHFDILWHVLKRLGRAVFGRYWSVLGVVAYLWSMDSIDSSWTGLERLLSTAELAAFLGIPVTTVYDWRTRGCGPAAFKIGKHLRFKTADVLAWLDDRKEALPSCEPVVL